MAKQSGRKTLVSTTLVSGEEELLETIDISAGSPTTGEAAGGFGPTSSSRQQPSPNKPHPEDFGIDRKQPFPWDRYVHKTYGNKHPGEPLSDARELLNKHMISQNDNPDMQRAVSEYIYELAKVGVSSMTGKAPEQSDFPVYWLKRDQLEHMIRYVQVITKAMASVTVDKLAQAYAEHAYQSGLRLPSSFFGGRYSS